MSIYTLQEAQIEPGQIAGKDLTLAERNIYGSSRLGNELVNQVIASVEPARININTNEESNNGTDICEQRIGDKNYEFSNHLGNVLQVTSDRKLAFETTPSSGIVDYYTADVIAQNDYYPFGMLMPERNGSSDDYRYGFQGQEKDDEIKGEGNSYDFGARIYDPRVGRWLSRDAFAFKYQDLSPYNYAANSPLLLIDVGGDSIWVTKSTSSDGKITKTIHVEVAIMNESDSNMDMCAIADGFERGLKDGLSVNNYWDEELNAYVEVEVEVSAFVATNMDQVADTDHLIVLVDDVYDEGEDMLSSLMGADHVGISLRGGQIAYVEVESEDETIETAIHEWGHTAGLLHFEEKGNVMQAHASGKDFNLDQVLQIIRYAEGGHLNKGENHSYAKETTNNWIWHTSSESEPYDFNTTEGEKIPLPIIVNKEE